MIILPEISNESCNSRRDSLNSATNESFPAAAVGDATHLYDELCMLRIVDNRQKERIEELNYECTTLVREVERLKNALKNSSLNTCINRYYKIKKTKS